jgi:hypothetical protein
MGSIIEMAARNQLLRSDGRHTATEFLAKIEGHLAMPPALDDDLPGRESDTGEPRPPTTWSTLAPSASGTESSAWIPAAPPGNTGKEGDK